jgi:L-lactate dehydrogenase (cytochrome)
MSSLSSWTAEQFDPGLNWGDVEWIKKLWGGKLIIKGILDEGDARLAADSGADALIVSNHGGRQLDGSIATLDALPDVVRAVNQAVPVYIDGGILRGSDIVKALASGANGVLIGRATLYGAIAAGEEGAHHALAILQDELKRTMQLCGVSKLKEIDQTLLARPHSSP